VSTNQAGYAPLTTNAPRRWDFLASLMTGMSLKSFVEVGCKEGRTTGHILANVPESTVFAIDPWEPVENSTEDYKDWNYTKIEKEFWDNVGEHKKRVRMLRHLSVDAARELKPWAPFDLVFIDAAHDYPNVMADIDVWWPLVKVGGVLAGHDFNHKWPGVERAVADSFDLMTIGVGPDSVWFRIKYDPEIEEAGNE